MRAILLTVGLTLLGLVGTTSAATSEEQVARGNYLVHDVAMCVQCHTPRTSDGELDRSREFRGAPIPVRSPYSNFTWAAAAPAIAGLPGWSTEDAVSLLTTGRRVNGYMPKPPMPSFRLTRTDAESVIAYLRSLR